MFCCDLLNRSFKETESRFGQESATMPLLNLGLELVDPIFGGSMPKSHSFRCKFEYSNAAPPRECASCCHAENVRSWQSTHEKCHRATPGKGILPAHWFINVDQCHRFQNGKAKRPLTFRRRQYPLSISCFLLSRLLLRSPVLVKQTSAP